MLWTGVVILQALSFLSEPTRSEYLSPIIEKLYRAQDYDRDEEKIPQNIFDSPDYEGKIETSSYGVPTSYFYITQKAKKPGQRDCLRCLIQLFRSPSFVDPCDCLPCSITMTNTNFSLPRDLFRYYQQFTCDSQKMVRDDFFEEINPLRNHKNRYVKFVEEYLEKEPKKSKQSKEVVPTAQSFDGDEQGRTRNYKIEIKMENGDNLEPTLQPQLGILFRNFDNNTEREREVPLRRPVRKKVRKILDSPGESRPSDKVNGGDATIRNASREESSPVSPDLNRHHVKQNVRRVFNEILSKVEKINKSSEIQKPSDTPSDVPTRRAESISKVKDNKKRSGLGKYRNPYQRPTYQVVKTKDKRKSIQRMGNTTQCEERHKTNHAPTSGRPQKRKWNKKGNHVVNGQNKTEGGGKLKKLKSRQKGLLQKSSRGGKGNLKKERLKTPWQGLKVGDRKGHDSDDVLDFDELEDHVKNILRSKYSPIKWETYDDDDARNKGMPTLEQTENKEGESINYGLQGVDHEKQGSGEVVGAAVDTEEGTDTGQQIEDGKGPEGVQGAEGGEEVEDGEGEEAEDGEGEEAEDGEGEEAEDGEGEEAEDGEGEEAEDGEGEEVEDGEGEGEEAEDGEGEEVEDGEGEGEEVEDGEEEGEEAEDGEGEEAEDGEGEEVEDGGEEAEDGEGEKVEGEQGTNGEGGEESEALGLAEGEEGGEEGEGENEEKDEEVEVEEEKQEEEEGEIEEGANKGRKNGLESHSHEGTILSSEDFTKEETKNTPGEDDSSHKSTTPLEQKWDKTGNTSSDITQPTTIKLHSLSIVTNIGETASHKNHSIQASNEDIDFMRYDKNRTDPEVAMPKHERVGTLAKKRTELKTTKEPDMLKESSTARSLELARTRPKKASKRNSVYGVTTERIPSPTYGDRLTMSLPKRNTSKTVNSEGSTSEPEILHQESKSKKSTYFTETQEDADADGTTSAPIHLLPERAEDSAKYSPRSDEVIGYRSIREDLGEKSKKRSTMNYLSSMTEPPFPADVADGGAEDEGQGSKYVNSHKMRPTSNDAAARSESGNVSEGEKPKFVLEFDEEPRKKLTDPAINIRLNIYSDNDPESVYRFLSRLIPRSAEHGRHQPSGQSPSQKYGAGPNLGPGDDKYEFIFPARKRYQENRQSQKGGRSSGRASANLKKTAPRPKFREDSLL